MKCPTCSRNHRVKSGMKCRCGYRFCFNPRSPGTVKMTDGKFLAAIALASRNGTSYFTANQLYAAYNRKFKPLSSSPILSGVAVIVLGAVISLTGIGAVFGVPVMVIGACQILWALIFRREPISSCRHFQTLIDKWLKSGKEIPNMITAPKLHQPPPQWSEGDIYDYGVEKILIVERDILVDLLVLNNQHTEQRMLVVSESGYPQYLAAKVNELLRARPDLRVYLLHDATPSGLSMHARLTAPGGWLELNGREVIDLGFTPTDFTTLRRTKDFDSHRKDRELPVDAILLTPLIANLGYCFVHGIPMYNLFEERRRVEHTGSYG